MLQSLWCFVLFANLPWLVCAMSDADGEEESGACQVPGQGKGGACQSAGRSVLQRKMDEDGKETNALHALFEEYFNETQALQEGVDVDKAAKAF